MSNPAYVALDTKTSAIARAGRCPQLLGVVVVLAVCATLAVHPLGHTTLQLNTDGLSRCKALWEAKEARHRAQLAARRRAVLQQCPPSAMPSRCALPLARKPRRAGDDPDSRGMHARAAWNLFEPEWVCESEERVGARLEPSGDTGFGIALETERYAAFGDGPKYLCGLDALAKQSSCLVYSVGSHNDYGFEKAIKTVHAHCEVHTFDPTLGLLPGDGGSIFLGAAFSTFHDLGLGEPPASGGGVMAGVEPWLRKLRPLRNLTRVLGHTGRTIDILKIDCESCEWSALVRIFDDLSNSRLHVGQLQIELHLTRTTSQQDINDFMAGADRAGLRIFHKEPNVLHGDGFTAVEYAFVHRSLSTHSARTCLRRAGLGGTSFLHLRVWGERRKLNAVLERNDGARTKRKGGRPARGGREAGRAQRRRARRRRVECGGEAIYLPVIRLRCCRVCCGGLLAEDESGLRAKGGPGVRGEDEDGPGRRNEGARRVCKVPSHRDRDSREIAAWMSTKLAQRGARGVGKVDSRVKNDEEDERDDGRGEAGLREVGGRKPTGTVSRKLSAASQRAGEACRTPLL
ncbi:methyltransferase domain-containing protein [Pavlovales sp. CCMP2436]|nr:methyltransferase domain-containing protein [Pavlovales sp. CCMP2436]